MALPYNHQSLSLSFSCRSPDKYVGACWGRDETRSPTPSRSWRHRRKPNRVSARDQTSECYRRASFFHSSPYLHVNSATLPRSVYVIDPFTFLATDRTQLESGHSMGQPNLVFMVKSLSSPPMRPVKQRRAGCLSGQALALSATYNDLDIRIGQDPQCYSTALTPAALKRSKPRSGP